MGARKTLTALQSPAFSAQTRLLVIAPHPDDETIATGMLLQRVRAAGGEVKILLLTAGDNNPWPQRWLERRILIHSQDRHRWGQRRQHELKAALQQLDVPAQSLQTLEWPDLGVTNVLLTRSDEAVARLAGILDAFQADLIAIPSLADRHPDHGSAHVLSRLALAKLDTAPRLFTYLIHAGAPEPGVIEVKGTQAQVDNKRLALEAHVSQMALSGRRMHRLAGLPERFVELTNAGLSHADVPQPSTETAIELPWQPPFWLQSRLHVSLAERSGVTTWRWTDAPLQRADDGVYHLSSAGRDYGPPMFARLACDLPTPWIFDHWGWYEL